MVIIKGHDFKQITLRDSYNRRALQYKNRFIKYIHKFDLTEDDVEIPIEGNAMRKAPASITLYMLDEHLYYSYNKCSKLAENLAMATQVVEYFLGRLLNEEITQEEFIALFEEDKDILEKRKKARETLGVDGDSTDFEKMHENFKKLSKKYHPDMPEGNTELFKKINVAHKILKKELT